MIDAGRIRRRGSDDGVTLIELLISIALIGIIAPVLVGVFTVIVRNSPTVVSRTEDARTLQGVVTWLPQDVDSTPAGGWNTNPSTPSGCTLSPGTNLLKLEWTENAGSGDVRFIADYRLHVNNGQTYVYRITCSGIGAGPFGGAMMRPMSSPVPALPVGWTQGQLPYDVSVSTTGVEGDIELITWDVRTLTGEIVRIDSATKNPANVLDTVPTETASGTTAPTTTLVATTTTLVATTTTVASGSTSSTSSTSSTTSTTMAPTTTTFPPCVVQSATLAPTSVKNTDANGNGKSATNAGVLAQAVSLTVATTGTCPGLDARVVTGAPNVQLFHNLTASGATFSLTFSGYPQGSSEIWADGMRAISIYDPLGVLMRTVTLEVK